MGRAVSLFRFRINPLPPIGSGGGGEDLAATLDIGNVSGTKDIAMTVGQAVTSTSGDAAINLNAFGDNTSVWASDGLNYGEVGIEQYPDYLGVWSAAYSQFLAFNNHAAAKHIELTNTIAGEGVGLRANTLGGSLGESDVIVFDVTLADKTTPSSEDKYPVVLSSRGATVTMGRTNSVILGGVGVKMLSDDTAYCQKLGFYYNNLGADQEGVLINAALTDDRTWTLPNESGTLAIDNGSGPSFENTVSPPVLTGDVDDFSPTGWDNETAFLRIDPGANDRDITGIDMSSFSGGESFLIANLSNSKKLTIKNNDGSSIAANRFLTKGDIDLEKNETILCVYDAVSQRIRPAVL